MNEREENDWEKHLFQCEGIITFSQPTDGCVKESWNQWVVSWKVWVWLK